MTAPLPPIPFGTGTDDIRAQLQSYAKLAVREALERARLAVKEAKENAFPQSADEAIHAMIEEYKND